MQLPFLARVLPECPIVPLLIGYQTPTTIERARRRAGARRRRRERLLLVASSDLSHYFDAATARRARQARAGRVAAFDAERLLGLFEQSRKQSAAATCVRRRRDHRGHDGREGARGAGTARVLNYAHSGDVSGDNSGVVGYLAGACGIFSDAQ